MARIRGIRGWLRAPRGVEEGVRRDVDEEIAFHLTERTRELEGSGVHEAEARSIALREFGDVERARIALRAESVALARRAVHRRWLGDLRQDVRYGARTLRTHPAFALVAVVTLALGIGANTAIFSMVNAVLLRPLPYAAPDRLVRLYETMPPEVARNVVSRGTYLDWRDGTRSFTEVAAYMMDFGYGITGEGEPLQATTGAQASPGLFRVLGVGALIGRTFTDAEGERGNDGVVLLSHDFWQDRFGGRSDMVGRTLTIDGSPMVVVGVMPPGFDFPSRRTDLWIPAAFRESDRESRQAHMLHVVGRLEPGVTLESARNELRSVHARQRERYPDAYDGWGTNVFPLRADIVRNVRSALWVLLGAVGLVLLIASVNVANLLLARSIAREREVSVRAALGAGRSRLVRQFLAEGAVLAALGGALGVVVAAVAVRLLVALDPGDIPLLTETRLDTRVLLFALAATLSTVFLFALAPALRIARADLHAGLRDGRGSSGLARHRGLRNGLLVTELALSVVLVVGAGLLLRSFIAVQTVDAGFDMDDVLTVSLNLPVPAYGDPVSHNEFYQQLIDRLTALPGVESAGGTSEPPIVGFQMTRSIAVNGHTFAEGERSDLPYHAVTPGYFDLLRIPLVAGRGFTAGDRAGSASVLVVNEALERRFWPLGEAVGRQIRLSEDGPWYEVVGVVGNTRHDGLDAEPYPVIYAPYAQKDWNWLTWMTVMVRTRGDALALAGPVQREVWAIDANLPIQRMTTLDAIYAESIGRRRFNTMLLGAFAALALVLGSVGVYGVVGYTVAQRSREIGIRMALGARAGTVVAGIVGDGLRVAGAGTAVGLAGAFAASGLLGGLLYGVTARDAVTFVAAPLLITGVALVATWLPARRAASVEPLRVLREI